MPAQVRSFETIERVRVAIAKFGHRSTEGLDELSGEIRRVIDWVEHDRPAYWKSRVQRAYDEVGEAKAALHRCLMYPINDETPSCADERAALKKAEAHLVYCREKQERVREWAQKLRHEFHEYTGRVSKLRRLAAEDVPKAIALLERSLRTLEQYVATSSGPTSQASGDAQSSDDQPAAEEKEAAE